MHVGSSDVSRRRAACGGGPGGTRRLSPLERPLLPGLGHARALWPLSLNPAEERLRDLGVFEKRRLRGGLINVNKYLKGGCHEDGARRFVVVPNKKTRQWTETDAQRFYLDMKKNFLPVQVTEHWNRLS